MRSLLLLALLGGVAACDGTSDAESDEDLTSLTARQRRLSFEGMVYVERGASNDAILASAHRQTQSAFGALLHANVAVQTRELRNVDPRSFVKRDVVVVDGAAERPMTEVRYTYEDNAVVPVAMARKTALSLALLGQGAESKQSDVVAACTENDKEAKDDAAMGLLWYDFDPSRATCRRAIESEQRAIDRAATPLDDKAKVPLLRTSRVYLPVTMQLARAATAEQATYPEYDRLFAGASTPGVLTVAMIAGRLAHEHVEARKDDGYVEWMASLETIFAAHPDFALTKIEPPENVQSLTIEGKRYDNLTFADFIQWTLHDRGWPAGMPPSSRDNIAKTVANRLDGHWVTFEKKVAIRTAGGEPKPLTIRIETLFGADTDPGPHRRALERGDVFVYNGHSYIGEGPLDPSNFTPQNFTRGYQLVFFDSCVSYNYYEKDFFTLKQGGSKNLDLVTNGIEAPVGSSGEAEGHFVSRLIDGSAPSYQTLLEVARATDALRVVDGEIDNQFDPRRTRIEVLPR